jgi:GT2 family glycosyltransferase
VKISVLIPTRARFAELNMCLRTLRTAIENAPSVEVEVAIGNDGSPEDQSQFETGNYPCPIRVVQGPRHGPAANRNNLARSASGDLLLFIDDDVKVDPFLIAAYARAVFDHPDAGILEGCIRREGQPRFCYDEVIENETGGYLWTANLAVRPSAFIRLGGFDTDYPFAAMEDTDFRYRSRVAGVKSVFCPDAVVSHPIVVRKGTQHLAKHRYSNLLFIEKHPEQLEDMRKKFTLVQCLRVVKHILVKRSVVQPWDGYVNLGHRIGSILRARKLVRQPRRIPGELRAMEAMFQISRRA